MKPRYFLAVTMCVSLFSCSLFARENEPIIRGEVNHTVSLPLRQLAAPRAEAEASVAPVAGMLNIAGQSFTKGNVYSDANGAAGATQYVQLVNSEYTVYNKNTGKVIAGPVAENALWSTFGGGCQTSNNGDGTVIYDQLANVWVFSHHAVPTGGPYLNCIAVSTSSDATGTYYLYGFELTQQYPDKPKIGVWPDGYYLSQDVLNPQTKVFVRSQACALQRDAMLAGTYANTICFQGSVSLPHFVVTTLDGQTPPPSGEVAFFWQLDQRPNNGRNNLNSFQFHVDWVTPANATFTGPVTNVLPAYTDICNNFKPCIPQPGTANVLQGWGDRIMSRVTYRNFGAYESVVMAHAVMQGSGATLHSGIRWYEYRTPLTPVIYQYGTFSPDNTYRWVPSIAQDQYGDMAVGYNLSSSTVNPGIAYSGRVPTDALGTMETPEVSVVNGGGSQTGTNAQWSSYTSMSVDPVDDCTFWYTAQYYKANSVNAWATKIVSFRFPSCTN